MVENPRLTGEVYGRVMWSRETIPTGPAHEARFEISSGLGTTYRKSILIGQVALLVRVLIRQIAIELEITIGLVKAARNWPAPVFLVHFES